MKKKYYCYLARCADGTLYAGYCADLIEREKKHNNGSGARYTKYRRPVKIVYSERFFSRSKAMKREAEIKQLPKIKKERLVISKKQ